MPDPISIASATALALHAAHLTKDFIAGIHNAPETVNTVLRDLAALEAVLKQLEVQLKKDPHLKNPANVETVRLVQQPLKNCTADAKQIKELLRKFVKPSGAAKTGKWNGFMFTFREKELRDLQYRLRDSRETLEGGLLVGTYVIGLDSNAEIHDTNEGVQRLDHRFVQYQLRRGEDEYSMVNTSYARSDVLGLEVGSRIPQWLNGTETVVGHGEKFPPAMSVVEEDWDTRSTVAVHENARVAEAQMSENLEPTLNELMTRMKGLRAMMAPPGQTSPQSEPEAAQQQPSAVLNADHRPSRAIEGTQISVPDKEGLLVGDLKAIGHARHDTTSSAAPTPTGPADDVSGKLLYAATGFNLNCLPVPRLRHILVLNNISYPPSAKKAQLIQLIITSRLFL